MLCAVRRSVSCDHACIDPSPPCHGSHRATPPVMFGGRGAPSSSAAASSSVAGAAAAVAAWLLRERTHLRPWRDYHHCHHPAQERPRPTPRSRCSRACCISWGSGGGGSTSWHDRSAKWRPVPLCERPAEQTTTLSKVRARVCVCLATAGRPGRIELN